jgi:hypothetical protein
MKTITKICFSVCILCIIGATCVSIMAIWNVVDDTALVWKSLSTMGVIFLASIMTVTVDNIFSRREKSDNSNE